MRQRELAPHGRAARAGVILLAAATAAAGCGDTDDSTTAAARGARFGRVHDGEAHALGDGSVRAYVRTRGRNRPPLAVGVELTADALENLPTEPSDRLHCYEDQCAPGHERVLMFAPAARHTPFRFVLFNWNPHGHPPPGVYQDVPHFDFHFYTADPAIRDAMPPGPCPGLLDCDAHARAVLDVPPQFMPPDYTNVGAVEVAMGNHLLDFTSPEWPSPERPAQPFTHTFIHGSFDGHIIFYEPMVTLAVLRSREDSCSPIKQAPAVESSGFYPTEYCIRYDAARAVHAVSLESLVWRNAPGTRGRCGGC